MSASIPFVKMHGAGNDFVMVDGRDLDGHQLTRADVAGLCDRRTGVGADGLIILAEPVSPEADFRMIYFNADGGEAEMCGNGARCTVSFAHRIGRCGDSCLYDTFVGPQTGRVLADGQIEVSLPSWKDLALGLEIQQTPWTEIHGCNTGVPHLVIPMADIDDVDLPKWGALLRYHERFAPAGTNVNWIAWDHDSGELLLRTYERGVEDETLACGTGASAAAVVVCELGMAESPVRVRTRGGDLLTVLVDRKQQTLRLCGPAVISFEGKATIDE